MFPTVTVLAALLAAPIHPAPTLRAYIAPPALHTAVAPASTTGCSIRSNAGNCYTAGEYCRRADLGKSTTDAGGRAITCGMESGKPHWQYSD